MGSFKWNNVSEEQNIHDGDDRISLLPDCLLHYILSFLPAKDAVTTCVLSKRWKYLWASVPSLDFDDSLLYSSQRDFWRPLDVTPFTNFVDKVLRLRDTCHLKRFRLSCRVCFSACHISEWISTSIKHNVQELDLCLFVEEPFMLPSDVFHNAHLKVVKLEMNCTLLLPPRISYPCLRTLHLCLVTFPNDTLMQGLFSSCPCLEELAILDCEWMNLKSISINVPSLKILIIDDLPFCSVDDLRGCEIKIDAKSLIVLKYSGYLSNEIRVRDLSSSALALIHIPSHCGRRQQIACRTVKLFCGLNNVSSLRISGGTIESLFLVGKVLDHLPLFYNLTLLELRGEFGKQSIEMLVKFFQFLPKLEYLHFSEGLGSCEYDCSMNMIPHTLSSLKIVKYHNLIGTKTEISFLKFLLENAIALEKLIISCSKSSSKNPENQEEITNRLHAFSKRSSHCVLEFA